MEKFWTQTCYRGLIQFVVSTTLWWRTVLSFADTCMGRCILIIHSKKVQTLLSQI